MTILLIGCMLAATPARTQVIVDADALWLM
jgi:hypothetical protein